MGEGGGRKESRFEVLLRANLSPDDKSWEFELGNKLPTRQRLFQLKKKGQQGDEDVTASGQKMTLMTISFTQQQALVLHIEKHSTNRVLIASAARPEELIAISFANLRFPNSLPKVTAEYIERLLSTGIVFNNSHKYIFYGHSNSQLKSRTCYLLCASNGEDITRRINTFGDFTKFTSVAKRAKRIGLLFSAAEASIQLGKKCTADIDDIELNGNIFTDGCGMIALPFAQELAVQGKISFQNNRYSPSAFQIRYKGYKGMLMVSKDLGPPPVKVHFRASMKKFEDCPDNSFSILDYSKPFTYACLNGELVTLLSCLGIPDEILERKQNAYFSFLEMAAHDPQTGFKYLCYKGKFNAAEEVLLSGLTGPLVTKIKKLTREEWNGTYKKNDVQDGNERVRIMIPDSRILFGVCDYTGNLKEGECHVRITTESGGFRSIHGGQVIVSRNPCLHPGDIRKFKPVECPPLSHLVDVIVFPTVGKRDAASLMSGGDLDGDRFFVSWDLEIIPSKLYEPYGYPPAKKTPRREITYENMIEYFARYNNASLGRVKNLYLDWCRFDPTLGAGSEQCQKLNRLFSSCVDGERIKIPHDLENPPKPKEGEKKFILDILCENVKKHAERIFQQDITSIDLTTREVLENLISSDDIMRMTTLLNEYELYLMTLRWCKAHEVSIGEFINYFDFGTFTTPQKHAILATLTETTNQGLRKQYIGPIFNALHQSELLTEHDELRSTNLHHPSIRWQRLYSSYEDNGLRLTANLEKAFENFDKKLLVFKVHSNLKIAIYIPKRIEKYCEVDVGAYKQNFVKLFAFEPESGFFFPQVVKEGYLLYFDGEVFQLFEKKRPNTFVWFALNEHYSARNNIESVGEFKVSIALNRFDPKWSRTRAKVKKQESTGIEIYVISNRDRVGHQILENAMNSVLTKEIVSNFENIPRDYNIEPSAGLAQRKWSEHCIQIVQNGQFQQLEKLEEVANFDEIFQYCLQLGEIGMTKLFEIVDKIFTIGLGIPGLRELILNLAIEIPTISIIIVEKLTKDSDNFTFPLIDADCYYYSLARALILSTNEFRDSSLVQFRHLLRLMAVRSGRFTLPNVVKLVKLILFSIRDSKLAQDFLSQLFSEADVDHPEFSMVIPEELVFEPNGNGSTPSDSAACLAYFRRFVQALAAEYVAEVEENCPCDFWGIPVGAEEIEPLEPASNGAVCSAAGSILPKNHLNYAVKLHEFFPEKLVFCNGTDPVPRKSIKLSKRLEPKQKCLEIKIGEKEGVFETILRSDTLSSSIRNEDHLRFCASKRATNKAKQRITVFDAVAISVTSGKLQFRILQKPYPPELFGATWNVYSCASTTNFSTMCTAILDLIKLKSAATTAYRDILALPWGDELKVPKAEITVVNNFNESQHSAVREALNNPLTLIWGPPGTGKTTVVVEIIMHFLRIYPHFRILISASTHNAVDNVMGRFLKERAEKGEDPKSEDAIRLTSDFTKVSENLKKWTLDAFVGANIQTNDKAKGAAAKKMKEAVLVFSTCSGAGVGLLRSAANDETSLWPLDDPDGKKSKKKKKSEEKFDVVIVDEASQITEPNAIIPLLKGSKFVVLVGDHVQLRPMVTGEMAKELGLETSLFEKLYMAHRVKDCTVMLNVQYRMHPDLSTFSANQFYSGKLLSGVFAENRILPGSKFPWPQRNNDIFPFVFIHCGANENFGESSKSNEGQARMTIQIVKMLRTSCNKGTQDSRVQMSIIILTPYTKQVNLIKTGLKNAGLFGNGTEVNTIDGFQGREADIIIFSTVRANRAKRLGFLDDKRRLNVAVTRACYGLIVIGEENTLGQDELWKNLMVYAAKVQLKVEK